MYTVRMKATDTAGNTGVWVTRKVERDTVAPAKPELSLHPDDINKNIRLTIAGEPGTRVVVNHRGSYIVPSSGTMYLTVVTTSQWTYNTTYTFTVSLEDRAKNMSPSVTVRHTTPPPPVRSSEKCEEGGGQIAFPFTGKYRVTSDYGVKRYIKEHDHHDIHDGVDFATPHGTEILAAEKGTVVYVSSNVSQGLGMIIHHEELGISTVYWHFKQNLVRGGERVQRGSVIGLSNNTGISTGDHLHFEVRVDGQLRGVNPWKWLGDCEGESNSNNENDLDGMGKDELHELDVLVDELIDEFQDLGDGKVTVNWTYDREEFPEYAQYQTRDYEFTTEKGENIRFHTPLIPTGKRDAFYTKMTFMNLTDRDVTLWKEPDGHRQQFSFSINPTMWVFKDFFLEDEVSGERYYFEDCSKKPSVIFKGAGECFLLLKREIVLKKDDFIKSFYLRGTIKRLRNKQLFGPDKIKPEKDRLFNFDLRTNQEIFDWDNSDYYLPFTVGDHVDEEPDLAYWLDADEFFNNILPSTVCVLGSIAFTAGTSLAICLGMPAAKIAARGGQVTDEDLIDIGTELVFYGAGKVMKVGYRADKGCTPNIYII